MGTDWSGRWRIVYEKYNDWIEHLTQETQGVKIRQHPTGGIEKDIEVFAYMRDNHGAYTLHAAVEGLALRKADPKVVAEWTNDHHDVARMSYTFWAIRIGYPEIDRRLMQATKRGRQGRNS